LRRRMPWAKFVSPVSENYLGTEIPGLLQAIHMERTGAQKFFRERWGTILEELKTATGTTSLTSQEQTIVAALMDDLGNPRNHVWGQARAFLKKQATTLGEAGRAAEAAHVGRLARSLDDPLPGLRGMDIPKPLRRLAERTQGLLDDVWDKWLKDPDNQERLRAVLGKKAGFAGQLTYDELKRIGRYWPHMRSMTPEERWASISEYTQEFLKTKVRRQVLSGQELRKSLAGVSDRHGKMMPDPESLQALGASDDVVQAVLYRDKRAIDAAKDAMKPVANLGTTALDREGKWVFYGLRYSEGLDTYIDDLSRAVAFSLPPKKYAGPRYVREGGKMVEVPGGGTKRRPWPSSEDSIARPRAASSSAASNALRAWIA
ncbi:hypothetical protein LCGC14_2959550, partial [marine sediment metagenome]